MMIKLIFPSDSYLLTTKLSIEEVNRRVLDKINVQKKFSEKEFANPLTRQYDGVLNNESFRIHQVIIGKRNSFAPLIIGNVNSLEDKTIIDLRMEIRSSEKAFVIIWLSLVSIICLVIIFISILHLLGMKQIELSYFLLIPFVMLIFGCFLPAHFYKIESKNSKLLLVNLLEGEMRENT